MGLNETIAAAPRYRYSDEAAPRSAVDQESELDAERLHHLAHDLRGLITIVSSCAAVLRTDDGRCTVEKRRELAQRILSACITMNTFVEGSLELGRLGQEGERAPRVPVLVTELLAEAASIPDPIAAARGVVIKAQVDSSDLCVTANPCQLLRAVTNLLGNAIKYSPPGGTVLLSGRSTDAGVAIAVTDQGPGIPTEELPSLFSPFFIGSIPPPSGTTRGFGLGLAISKRLVEAQGGAIEVRSLLGEGSTFIIQFPWEGHHRSAAD